MMFPFVFMQYFSLAFGNYDVLKGAENNVRVSLCLKKRCLLTKLSSLQDADFFF